MKKYLRFINKILLNFGLNIRKFLAGFKGLAYYFSDYLKFKKTNDSKLFPFVNLYPIFGNRFGSAGTMNGHYFHQDYYIAKRIYETNPEIHLDVGSRIDGFVAHVAIFRKIWLIDVRPMQSSLENITFVQADLTSKSERMKDFADSVSCLHAIEHFGLGRYGDPIDPDGHLKGLENIYSMIRPGGTFYFSTPIGPQRIEFNAHRVFSLQYLLDLFASKYEIIQFSLVDDKGDMHNNMELSEANIASNFGCQYGCGIFEMRKK